MIAEIEAEDPAKRAAGLLYRPMSADELPTGEWHGRRVARIVHRGQLDRAVSTVP
ncbi:MAG: hypothetical protein WKF48_07170 [Solirubrobacteraceae bacterium]